jgi:Putative regulator of cell autolysis
MTGQNKKRAGARRSSPGACHWSKFARRREVCLYFAGMKGSAETTRVIDDTAARERAKERLYVLFQVLGWGFFLSMQLLFSLYFGARDGGRDPLIVAATVVMVASIGLLLSHGFRRYMSRWGWKQLGWRQLLPRVVIAALVLAVLWNGIGYGLTYFLIDRPWESKYNPVVLFTLGSLNGALIFVGWMCLYLFYHLFDRFNRSEIERLRLNAVVKDAELRALKSQVNPHFIFNSLNSLRALIDENPGRAREAVTQLANLLRYSLQSGQLETVPLEAELRVVNDYLALEQVRHEERLRVRLDVAPETLKLPIPPMLLQTLVENAIKYGISRSPTGGEIAIVARSEGESLRLQVTNPGELSNESRERCNGAESTGLGLSNAAERLRLLFGDRARLQLQAASPAKVMAEAVVPTVVVRG